MFDIPHSWQCWV